MDILLLLSLLCILVLRGVLCRRALVGTNAALSIGIV